MITARRIALTAAAALYLLVALVGMVAMGRMGPIFNVVAMGGMVGTGFMVSDWVGKIWNMNGQYDSDEV
jgi:hypothetical protein